MKVWHLTSRQLYDLICESYDELEKDPKSFKHAVYFCLIGYHLIEWILNDKESRSLFVKKFKIDNTKDAIRKYIRDNVDFYQTIRALANGAKHFDIDKEKHKQASTKDNLLWNEIDISYENCHFKWGYDGIFVKSEDKLYEILNVYEPLKKFYDSLFN